MPFEERKHVGAWMVPSYDPELGLVYIGTSVTSPAPKFLIGGTDLQHLYHNSTLALDADTGEIAWYYQHMNDHWDLDHPFERLLVDTAVAPDADAVEWINPRLNPGEIRKVMTGIPGKTGVVYTLDRETGEFPVGEADHHAERDQRHRRRHRGGDREPRAHLHRRGAGDAHLPARHRRQGLGGRRLQPADQHDVHAAAQRLREHAGRGDRTARRSTPSSGERASRPGPTRSAPCMRSRPRPGSPPGSTSSGRQPCRWPRPAAGSSSGGDVNGRFRAFDDTTGEILWEINLGSPVSGFPITYAVDGRQYVAVSTGTARFINLTPELRPSDGNNLFVFALP